MKKKMEAPREHKKIDDREKKNAASKNVEILFTDPLNFDYEDDCIVLGVTKDFYEIMKKGARLLREDDGTCCYYFGELFDDDYIHRIRLETKNRTVSFLSHKPAKKKHIEKSKYPTRDYEKHLGKTVYNDESYLKKELYPEIIWLGKVRDPSCNHIYAHLHYHVDPKTDDIDSILVDCNYMYDAKTDSDISDSYDSEVSYFSSEEDSDSESNIGKKRAPKEPKKDAVMRESKVPKELRKDGDKGLKKEPKEVRKNVDKGPKESLIPKETKQRKSPPRKRAVSDSGSDSDSHRILKSDDDLSNITQELKITKK